ncbi:hypothetical protein GCM10023200_37490 [Actinomycetospora chlora]|jgi:hypothetical protein|uniref:Uncharacterized protein n=1 Tax=Actinomycetospora chlora TaxID=663608 RepID=A0ABP9BMJ8_9PSEU
MTDEKSTDQGRDHRHGGNDGQHASDIPETSPSTESGVALSHQVEQRDGEGEQES